MLNSIITGTEITMPAYLICSAVSLLLGAAAGGLCMFRSKYSQSFVLALAVLPFVVQTVIMLVNGNIGTGVAVAGTFSLVRFRSATGTAREILLIFLTMALGLATGMGYVGLAVILFFTCALFLVILQLLHFGGTGNAVRVLKITIAETLDYDGLFDDLFEKYTTRADLDMVKSTNMGTLYELDYSIILKDEHNTKDFLDELRCRNGNLNIVCGRPVTAREAL